MQFKKEKRTKVALIWRPPTFQETYPGRDLKPGVLAPRTTRIKHC